MLLSLQYFPFFNTIREVSHGAGLCCRYLALESMCLLATSEFSHEAVKKHQETVVNALKVYFISHFPFLN